MLKQQQEVEGCTFKPLTTELFSETEDIKLIHRKTASLANQKDLTIKIQSSNRVEDRLLD